MAWQSQPPDPPQQYQGRSPNTGRGIAWLAIFLSLAAICISTFVFLSTYDDGKLGEKLRERGSKLKENIQVLKDETANALKSRKEAEPAGEGAKASADAKPADSAAGDVRWDKIQERIQNLRKMVSEGDDRADSYLDKLRDDLAALREYSTTKGREALDKAGSELQSIRGSLKENAAEAGKRLKSLSEEIAPGDGSDGSASEATEEPAEKPKKQTDDANAEGADKKKPAQEQLPDLPPPPAPDEN